ncbi:MEKHLA domain-containing protein [Amantichitinum ursilacus]|uniref:MEKHLA domain protein n=1 Tax=Amantichitinum ursilacus TaxID=857265 RepID=A0A0N0GKQ7_9NEIS|nr:MEKHLA domain-containing protein [Amantichitinum ursilacus]KPC49146.1 MEKHLA domain protein [Amantichitinum ursilacus]
MSHPLRLDFARLLLNSHALLLGEPLADASLSLPEATRWLYEDAPFCLLAHSAELDPRFIYANMAAQRCFAYDWNAFFGMPSRLSAQAPEQTERQQMLDQVARDGFITGYRGLRIDGKGQRFWIEDGRLWNLLDDAGTVVGQAVAFSDWRPAPTA